MLVACHGADQPVEVGKVGWGRDHDAALAKAKETGKPVFMLFQEVPGCQGCQNFGKEVLSDPLVIEAIESDFVALLIHNNTGGKDAEILKRYEEPAWNFQVIRFIDSEGKDLIPRKDRVWSIEELVPRMMMALDEAGKESAVLELMEPDIRARRQLALAQRCFWTGELRLGEIEGVLRTEAGWMEGREVTLVDYDPKLISREDLIAQAKAISCADKVYSGPALAGYKVAKESDQKKQLQGTAFAKLQGLGPYQRTKINAYARSRPEEAKKYLTPRQLEKLPK